MMKETFATVITGILVIGIMGFLIWELPQIDLVVQEMRKWMNENCFKEHHFAWKILKWKQKKIFPGKYINTCS